MEMLDGCFCRFDRPHCWTRITSESPVPTDSQSVSVVANGVTERVRLCYSCDSGAVSEFVKCGRTGDKILPFTCAMSHCVWPPALGSGIETTIEHFATIMIMKKYPWSNPTMGMLLRKLCGTPPQLCGTPPQLCRNSAAVTAGIAVVVTVRVVRFIAAPVARSIATQFAAPGFARIDSRHCCQHCHDSS